MALTITVESTVEVDIILEGLRKLPMEKAEMLVYGIRMQIMQQIQQQEAEKIAQEAANSSEAVAAPTEDKEGA